MTVDPKALEATVRKLSVDFHPRDHTNVANLDLAAAWIKAQLGDGAPHLVRCHVPVEVPA